MLSRVFVIENSIGLHARPASLLAIYASKFESNIRLEYRDSSSDLKSSIRTLALGIGKGEVVRLVVEGHDEKEAFERITRIFDEINSQ